VGPEAGEVRRQREAAGGKAAAAPATATNNEGPADLACWHI
jgi:hypothetical protein